MTVLNNKTWWQKWIIWVFFSVTNCFTSGVRRRALDGSQKNIVLAEWLLNQYTSALFFIHSSWLLFHLVLMRSLNEHRSNTQKGFLSCLFKIHMMWTICLFQHFLKGLIIHIMVDQHTMIFKSSIWKKNTTVFWQLTVWNFNLRWRGSSRIKNQEKNL